MDMIQRKVEALRKRRDFKNLFEIMCSNGQAVAAEYKQDDAIKTLTYSDYERIALAGAEQLAGRLKAVPRNTFVALRFANHPLWPAAFWAIVFAGYRPLLLDAGADDAQVKHVLRQAGRARSSRIHRWTWAAWSVSTRKIFWTWMRPQRVFARLFGRAGAVHVRHHRNPQGVRIHRAGDMRPGTAGRIHLP